MSALNAVSTSIVHHDSQGSQNVADYWTPERMAEAKPMPMPSPEGGPTIVNDAGQVPPGFRFDPIRDLIRQVRMLLRQLMAQIEGRPFPPDPPILPPVGGGHCGGGHGFPPTFEQRDYAGQDFTGPALRKPLPEPKPVLESANPVHTH